MPSWKELKRFCERDDWELYRATDHWYFRKRDTNGNIRSTKVSMSSSQIGSRLWARILKQQLQISQTYFNGKI